jgi:hypothetical protein
VELSLQFDDNGTGHADLVLRFAGQTWDCDSYYLALDGELLPDREDAEKVQVVLRRVLHQWLLAVEDIPDDGTVYLPYDFSDQYTGWLRCRRSGDMAEVCRGWAEVPGWSLSPSSVGDYLTRLRGFRPDGPWIRAPITTVVEAVRTSIAKLA